MQYYIVGPISRGPFVQGQLPSRLPLYAQYLLYQSYLICRRNPLPGNRVIIHHMAADCKFFHKDFAEIFQLPSSSLFFCGRSLRSTQRTVNQRDSRNICDSGNGERSGQCIADFSYSSAPIFFIRFSTISPALARSSAVKAWRKLSENRIWAFGGNSSSPTQRRS